MSTGGCKKMTLIFAMDLDQGIGKGGKLPWHIPKDFAFFVEQTTRVEDHAKRNVVVMGRKCWESIPEKFRPLKRRFNVVISRTLSPSRTDNLWITSDFDAVLKELTFGLDAEKYETIFNIGGREVYKWALDNGMVERLLVTRIDGRFDTDVRMPEIDWSRFEEDPTFATAVEVENNIPFSFHVYKSKKTD